MDRNDLVEVIDRDMWIDSVIILDPILTRIPLHRRTICLHLSNLQHGTVVETDDQFAATFLEWLKR